MEKYTTKLWENNGEGHYTRRESMYLEFLEKLLPKFSGGKVLEIGPGTGEFAKILINKFNITEYTVLDLEKNVFDSVNNVKKSGLDIELSYVFSQNYKTLLGEKFDLIVSNICIPETPKDYREDLLNNIIPNTKSSMIIGQLTGKWVNGDEYEKWIKNLFYNNFNKIKCELTSYANCYALAGYNRK